MCNMDLFTALAEQLRSGVWGKCLPLVTLQVICGVSKLSMAAMLSKMTVVASQRKMMLQCVIATGHTGQHQQSFALDSHTKEESFRVWVQIQAKQ